MNIGMRMVRRISPPPAPEQFRSFETNFDKLSDFAGMYITPPGVTYATDQALTPDGHLAWILGARSLDNELSPTGDYFPHRGYPTVQFQKTSQGALKSPFLISLKLKVNISLQERGPGKIADWFSPATFTGDASDSWRPTLTVTLGPDGYLRWMHVPDTNQAEYIYQARPENDPAGALKFPLGQSVRLDYYLDTTPGRGRVLLYQNGLLISMAALENGNGFLTQAHFGMYASAAVASGAVTNRKLRISEVKNYDAAWALITSAF